MVPGDGEGSGQDPRCKIGRGFIGRELTGHTKHKMGFCDRSTFDNQQIENTKIKT